MEGPKEGKQCAHHHRRRPLARPHRRHPLIIILPVRFVPVVVSFFSTPPLPIMSALPTRAVVIATHSFSSLDSIEPILRLRKTTRKSTENSPSTRKSNAVSSAVYSQVLTNYDHADEEKCSRSRKRRRDGDDDNDGGARGGDILDGGGAVRTEEEDDGGEGGARVDPPARERPAVSSACGTTRFRVVLLLLLNLSIILLPALIVTLTLARTLISDEKNIGNPISYGISG